MCAIVRFMKSVLTCLLFLFFLSTTFKLAGQTTNDIITPAGKIELFDGKSLSGWTFCIQTPECTCQHSIWSVRNGVIFCEGKPNGYARTRWPMYRDYQLHAEWRWPNGKGNSGIFVHLNPPDTVWPLCFEAQLLTGDAGEVRLNGGSHLAAITDPKVISVPRQQPNSEKPPGEWNFCDLVCRSNTITVHINGVLQNEVSGTSVDSGANPDCRRKELPPVGFETSCSISCPVANEPRTFNCCPPVPAHRDLRPGRSNAG